MNFRLRTSKEAEKRIKNLQVTTNLTPNILVRLAVGLSLRNKHIPEMDIVKDFNGIEFNRNTLTGEFDYIYKALITQHAQREVTDEEFFPGLFNAHLERGIRLLENEYKHAGNLEKLQINLLNLSH